MNERIKELEKLATPRCYDETGCYIGNRFDPEKFAELIVKECADFIKPLGDWCGGHGEPQMPSTSECAKRLKDHFGVEE